MLNKLQKTLNRTINRSCILLIILAVSGCASIPQDDIAFINRAIDLGASENQAVRKVEARGFREASIRKGGATQFNKNTQRFETRPGPLKDTVKANIGFVRLKGVPKGELRCFHQNYNYLIASGERIICWTTDNEGLLTWRQAGWSGATL